MSGDRDACNVEDCTKPVRSAGGTLCEMHYYRLRRTGTTDQLRPWSRNQGDCSIGGCEKPVKESGLCSMHASRVRRHGDPDAFTHQRDRNLPRGEAHHSWTGPEATYENAHRRVKRKRGRPSTHKCADCGAQAQHWSYDHLDPDERVSPGGRAYSLDINHYVPRCVSCHKTHDCARLREVGRIIGNLPRCGKPMRVRRDNYPASSQGSSPICGLPEGHSGYCRSAESYQRSLEKERERCRRRPGRSSPPEGAAA